MNITYTIHLHPECEAVRGNALASGDAALDRAAEDDILAELRRGNEWAWCTVEVRATAELGGVSFQGTSCLGCCSYKDETNFREGGYFESMCDEAKDDLIAMLRAQIKLADTARAIMRHRS